MHEIKIYGEIIPFEEDFGSGYVNLSNVQEQLSKAEGKDILVKIRSLGGEVETGFSIYNELRRYAKDNNTKVTTLGEGQVASIATVIFLAGDERILTGYTEPFVHNAWTYTEGDAKRLQRVALELQSCNDKIADHYVLHTDLTKEEALALMENETSITAEEAVNMRFATSIEEVLRPVALKRFQNNININNKKMNNKSKTILNKVANFLKSFQNKVVETAEGGELDFYELEDNAEITALFESGEVVRAYFDGADAVGSFVLLSGETYVFEAGNLIEIIPAEMAAESTDTTLASLEAENEELKSKLEEITNKAIELDAQNKAKALIISNYQNSKSKSAPILAKDNLQKEETKEVKISAASEAVSNLKKFKLNK